MTRGETTLKTNTVRDPRLTDRDNNILIALYTYRALSGDQLYNEFFKQEPELDFGRKSMQRRLTHLVNAGYLWRGTQMGATHPDVYRIAERGVQKLPDLLDVEPEMIQWRPDENEVSPLFLKHLLSENQVRLAIESASNQRGWTMQTWLDDKTLQKDKDYVTITGPRRGKRRASVVPDGYFHLIIPAYAEASAGKPAQNSPTQKDAYSGKEPRNVRCMVEVDLNTVTGQAAKFGRRDWARKVRTYCTYFKSDLFQKRYHTTAMRVLTITTTPRRLEHLKYITEEVGGKHRFWFSTLNQVTPQAVLTEPLWQISKKDGLYALIEPLQPNSPPPQSGKTT